MKELRGSIQRDGDVDAQIAGIGEQLRGGRVEDEAIGAGDGLLHAVVDGARRGFPRQAAPLAVQLELVDEALGLAARADELHDGEELRVVLVLLLLLEHEHEVVAEARLHHDPVDRARQRDVRRQEHDILALQRRYAFMVLH